MIPPTGGSFPAGGKVESRDVRRGSQDSNLGPAVLETVATTS